MKIYITTFGLILMLLAVACRDDDVDPVMQKSNAKQITSFAFMAADNSTLTRDIVAVVDHIDLTISTNVPYGTEVSALNPDIQFSDKAIISPQGSRDFTETVAYTVTAADGSKAVYNVTVVILPNAENQISVFQFLLTENPIEVNVLSEIDHDVGTIVFEVPDGADITALLPSIEVSPGATYTPQGVQNFKEPVVYTVTAQDGTQTEYKITTKYSQRGVLIEIYKANPGSNLSWDLEEQDISNWSGVTTDLNGNITRLYLFLMNLSTLPPEIGHLDNLTELYLDENSLMQLPSEIGQLGSLTWLVLADNNLTQLPPEIGQLRSLTTLHLRGNNLKVLPPEIGQLDNLTTLLLGSNDLKQWPLEIRQLNLKTLGLGYNNLKQWPVEIDQMRGLTKLYLTGNNLTAVPAEIGQLDSLVTLVLSDNRLTNLPPEIGKLSNLVGLYLNSNALLTSIPSEISKLSNLNYLHLTSNPSLNTIPAVICAMEARYGTTINLDPGVLCQ